MAMTANGPARSALRHLAALCLLIAAPDLALGSEPVARFRGEVVVPPSSSYDDGAGSGMTHFLRIARGKSVIIDLPLDARQVIISNPAIVNALVRSARKGFILGQAPGLTSVYFLNNTGNLITAYNVEVWAR